MPRDNTNTNTDPETPRGRRPERPPIDPTGPDGKLLIVRMLCGICGREAEYDVLAAAAMDGPLCCDDMMLIVGGVL